MKNLCDCLTKPFKNNYVKDKVNPQKNAQNNEKEQTQSEIYKLEVPTESHQT
jgi:hypothetical protein